MAVTSIVAAGALIWLLLYRWLGLGPVVALLVASGIAVYALGAWIMGELEW